MTLYLIKEHDLKTHKMTYYGLDFPYGAPHWYRQVTSWSAFFHGGWRGNRPCWHYTDNRLFTYEPVDNFDDPRSLIVRQLDKEPFKIEKQFTSMYEFYDHIGWDRKAHVYKSGERMKTWNGKHHV